MGMDAPTLEDLSARKRGITLNRLSILYLGENTAQMCYGYTVVSHRHALRYGSLYSTQNVLAIEHTRTAVYYQIVRR